MSQKTRVRFAPSPTGGLHLGGMRTVLYNYLFAKKTGGDFILRIEDTDQTRYVEGAEQYIYDCLQWAGLEADESPGSGGDYGPYRQSERKELYRPYAEKLIEGGFAYYAFDTPAELEKMRYDLKSEQNPSPQYDHSVRMTMRNSLTLPAEEVNKLLAEKVPHVIRVLMPGKDAITFTDLIRGSLSFDTAVIDDKVLIKADGMPTYHLAVVVDDFLMKITHAFRGEEWLPSAPVHVFLWDRLFGLEHMPQWAHLPLILGPHGKLSKRDGVKYGFPVYALGWTDPVSNQFMPGFKEKGFLAEAFINFLALLGWNDGTEQELFSKAELIERFSIDRIHSAGARFDYEKAKWFNHEWIKKAAPAVLHAEVKAILEAHAIPVEQDEDLDRIIELVKDRCALLPDFVEQASFFFKTPAILDLAAVKPKWNPDKKTFFLALAARQNEMKEWNATQLEHEFKSLAIEKNIKPGDLQLPLRIMLVGGKFGPPVFQIAELLGKEETISRIEKALVQIDQ